MDQDQKDVKRTERTAVLLTPEEKQAVRVIAAFHGVSESDLLRDTPLTDVLAEFNARVLPDPSGAVTSAARDAA